MEFEDSIFMETAIKIDNLTKIYKIFDNPIDRLKESLHPFHKRYSRDFYALTDLSFTIEKGETIGIIGKNGAGKSTLLKIITGVLAPTSGKVEVQGRIASLLELGAGFNPEMTGLENIYLNGTVLGYSHEEMDRRLPDIVKFADIGDFINQPVKMYSSGMFARLAFAVNAYVEPDILIVDEALSVGDVAFQTKCITRMRHMIEAGVTVLFVTHDIGVVKSFCSRCLYLEHGKLKMQGAAEQVADAYLREMRDEMNAANDKLGCTLQSKESYERKLTQDTRLNFREDDEFASKVAQFRQGTGKARVMALDVLDSSGENLILAQFNERIRLRIHLRFFADAAVGVGYHIRDDKNEEIIGGYTTTPSGDATKWVEGKAGDCYIIEFTTRLPLVGGRYNISLVVSSPLDDEGNAALFSDFVENAFIFTIEHHKPRLWDKVYIPAEARVAYLGNKE